MAELTQNDVQRIVDNALSGVRSTLNDIRNTLGNNHNQDLATIQTNLLDLRNLLQTMRADAVRLGDTQTHIANTNRNIGYLQQYAQRLDSNTQSGLMLTNSLQQIIQVAAEMHQRIQNVEDFMSSLADQVHNMQAQLTQLNSPDD